MTTFETLNAVNVNAHTEKKNGLTYLSWAWAWAEIKKVDPAATYTIYENANGLFYHTDGRTCWVKTGVTVRGVEHIEYLPVMDHRNKSIPADKVESFDVNKAIQRSLTKACARHGLGLYIYAGEDLPEEEAQQEEEKKKIEAENATQQRAERLAARQLAQQAVKAYAQQSGTDEGACWQTIAKAIGKASKDFTKDDWKQAQTIAEGWKK